METLDISADDSWQIDTGSGSGNILDSYHTTTNGASLSFTFTGSGVAVYGTINSSSLDIVSLIISLSYR